MPNESTPQLVRTIDRMIRTPHSVENPLTANTETTLRDVFSLMRLRLHEGGINIPDALQYLGQQLAEKYKKPGVQLQRVIEIALQTQPDVFKQVFPHLGLSAETPKTEAEGLFIRDLLAAKKGELSRAYIASRIDSFLFSEPREKAA
ncbi:MAG: hypothetical protein Q7S79_03595 [bacterium]|nr:hypothetical protein [bacterium]